MNTVIAGDELEYVTSVQSVIQVSGVPVLPSVDLNASYCVPRDATEPGGSWFDVVVLPDDRVALVVGEAPGIGLAAATLAGEVRAVLHSSLRRDAGLVDALHLADAYADDVGGARGTSVLLAILDPARAAVTYATAGHAGPLLLPAHGSAIQLDGTGGGVLGTGTGTGYAPETRTISPGDLVLLASAAAHRSAALTMLDLLGEAAEMAFEDLTVLADASLARLGAGDSLCLLAGRLRDAPHRELRMRLHLDREPVRSAREELGGWLEGLRASSMDHMALTHAAAELVTNAVDHGGSDEDRHLELHGRLGTDGVLRVEVLDHGTWRPPSEDLSRGRGLAMAAGLVDHLGVATGPFGTRALLQHRMIRPVAIETTAGSGRSDERPAPVEVEYTRPHIIELRGTFGHDDVERVAAEILVANRGGTIDLCLDLTALTELSTSGARLLVDLTSVNRSIGMFAASIDIVARAGSMTQHTLAVTGIPHRVD
jgi:anti-sigma regulatory factor (Ser/Thr protein kinase)/anti-anti-sigma regulatory factor